MEETTEYVGPEDEEELVAGEAIARYGVVELGYAQFKVRPIFGESFLFSIPYNQQHWVEVKVVGNVHEHLALWEKV